MRYYRFSYIYIAVLESQQVESNHLLGESNLAYRWDTQYPHMAPEVGFEPTGVVSSQLISSQRAYDHLRILANKSAERGNPHYCEAFLTQ